MPTLDEIRRTNRERLAREVVVLLPGETLYDHANYRAVEMASMVIQADPATGDVAILKSRNGQAVLSVNALLRMNEDLAAEVAALKG